MGHFLADWTGRGGVLLTSLPCLSARSPFVLTDSFYVLCCTARSFSDVCDKNRHEVSPGQAPHSDGEWSRHIWLFSTDHTSTLVFFFFLCPRPSLVHRTVILKSVYECRFFFWLSFCFCTFCSKRGRSRVWRGDCMPCSSPDGLFSLTKATWRYHSWCVAVLPQRNTRNLSFKIGSPRSRFFPVLPNASCYCLFNWECYLMSI